MNNEHERMSEETALNSFKIALLVLDARNIGKP
jgi:hypothetical protein